MGEGIAKVFKQKFGGKAELKLQRRNVGEVAKLSLPKRNIYYLITKKYYYEKPTYADVWETFKELRRTCQEDKVKKLALPKLGCGLDRLKWEDILTMLNFVFFECDIEIIIYVLPEQHVVKVATLEAGNFEPIWDKEALRKAQKRDEFCEDIRTRLKEKEPDVESAYYEDKTKVLYRIDDEGMEDKVIAPKA
ncbi:hypothetical protein NQ314_014983 [Rhamnusium bicolor]|uniref:Macro domain-containing protein n=1 Tax=Rhamnusium bicolor TaxID=1586634 RepID=A0AAV8X0X9_9CUCU|nr:hypothetical protein NQ314_014983 [Rhamnusium bicolor]